MFVLDPMGWADCFTPEDLIEEMFRQLPDLSFPIPLLDIAKACGIADVVDISQLANTIKDKPSRAFPEGFLIDKNKCSGVIFYKDNEIAPYRKRFTIAHELAHFLFPHHINKLSLDDIERGDVSEKISRRHEHEKEADWFAAELLLPKHLLHDALNSQSLTLQFVKDLSDTSRFSFAPLLNRCITLLDTMSFVAIHSKDGVCGQIWTNWDVLPGELLLAKGDPLPDLSVFCKQINIKEEHITEKTEVDVNSWFSLLLDEFTGNVYEQTYYQQNGYTITLLIINK
jgi:Zn-dependent peptidase ImmA (M78 family)|tara:strand:- start:2683 stop:3534 length:852 start_codon:yes stop_codon:yes gene_type:complete